MNVPPGQTSSYRKWPSASSNGQTYRKSPASPATEAARCIKPATIGQRVAATRYARRLAGHYDDPFCAANGE
jgi:hypothetical protein